MSAPAPNAPDVASSVVARPGTRWSRIAPTLEASPWAAQLLVAVAALVAHLGALRNRYALDDGAILANPAIASWRALPRALTSPWWYATGRLYRPLALLSLGVDRQLGGMPWTAHAENVVLHALVAALVVRLALRFLAPGYALVAGALFALLPVHVEAVASIVGRAELLAALALVTLLLLVTRVAAPTPRARLAAALLAAAALGAKESGAAAPLLVLAAAHALPRQRPHARAWAGASLAGTLAMLAARVAVLGTLGGDLAHPFFRGLAPLARIGVAITLLPRTAAMLALPVQPAIEEVPPLGAALHPSAALLVVGVALLLAVLVLALRHVRTPDVLTLGACVLAATIAPTSNLLFAEGALTARTLYAPSIGAVLMIGGLLAWLASRTTRPVVLGTVAGAVAAACAASALLDWREVRVWRDTPTVIATMVARRPDNYRGHELLAYAARDAGDDRAALRHFARAIALFPGDPELLTDAATVALRQRDTTVATRWLETAVQGSPRAARARTRLYTILRARGDSIGARRLLREGLREEPEQRSWATLLAEDDARAGTRTRMP